MIEIIKEHILKLYSESLSEKGVIDWASPVPVFGDYRKAKIATVGINPSNLEFQDLSGEELTGEERRFHTLNSLGLSSWKQAGSKHFKTIEESCVYYFHHRPYTRWFNQLDYLLAETGHSFYNYIDKVCHFDLVPYTTGKKWAFLKPCDSRFLKDLSKQSLKELVGHSQVELIILNGKQIVEEYQDIFEIHLKSKKESSWDLPRKNGNSVSGVAYEGEVKVGSRRKIKVLGFNHNIQSSYGMTKEVKYSIRRWITKKWREL